MNHHELQQWSHSHETSIEIATAIEDLYLDKMERVWCDPLESEKERVLNLAWSLAGPDTTILCWGAETITREAKNEPATYGEALDQGWIPLGFARVRGYVPRGSDVHSAPLHAAGGRRKGLYYALASAHNSTTYCYRLYLSPPKGSQHAS